MGPRERRRQPRRAGRSWPAGHATAWPTDPIEQELRLQEHWEEHLKARRSRQEQLVRQGVDQIADEGHPIQVAFDQHHSGMVTSGTDPLPFGSIADGFIAD
jgi:hypothetical protein